MMEKLDAMGTQMGELHRKVDTMAEEREAQMVALSAKVDQLLLKDHEQVQTSALEPAQRCPRCRCHERSSVSQLALACAGIHVLHAEAAARHRTDGQGSICHEAG